MRRAKIVLAGFIAFLIALVALADSGRGQQVFDLVKQVPAGDKFGHFALFGTLAFLVNLILRGAEFRLGRMAVLKGSVVVTLAVTAEEVSQRFFRSRSFDWFDLAADLIGIWVCGRLAAKYLAGKGRSKMPAKTL